jgi:hypothetical protein
MDRPAYDPLNLVCVVWIGDCSAAISKCVGPAPAVKSSDTRASIHEVGSRKARSTHGLVGYGLGLGVATITPMNSAQTTAAPAGTDQR